MKKGQSRYPQLTGDEVRDHLENSSRRPFREVLARFLECAPSDEAIAAQAEAHPDRWSQSLAIVARLSGYTEKLEIEGSISHNINGLSDLELQLRIAELSSKMELDSESNPPTA